jgi:hypothetical protein
MFIDPNKKQWGSSVGAKASCGHLPKHVVPTELFDALSRSAINIELLTELNNES